MGTINFNIKNHFNVNNDNNKNNIQGFMEGDIISGVITGKDNDKTTVRTKDLVLNLDSSDVSGNIKDNVNFEVVGKDPSKLVLKQIKTFTSFDNVYHSKKADMISNEELLDMFKENKYIKNTDTSTEDLSDKEFQEKMLLLKIQRSLKFGGKNISKNVIAHLQSQGLSIDKVSISILSELIGEVKSVVQKDMSEQQLKDFLKNVASTTPSEEMPTKELIANMLNDNGFEVSKANLNNVFDNLQTLVNVQENIQNTDIKNILTKELDLTVANINNNTYSNNILQNYPVSSNMQQNITKHLQALGVYNEENQKIAEMLFTNNIDITEDNINKVLFFQNDFPNFSSEDLINLTLDMTKNEISIENFDLLNLSNKNVNQSDISSFVDNIKNTNVNDGTFIYLDENDIEFTLTNILQNKDNIGLSSNLSNDAILQKKLFLQTQLKLTYDSMYSMAKNGINIDVMPLKQALSSLENYEQGVAQKNINSTILQDETQKELFTKTMSFVSDLKLNSQEVISSVLSNYDDNKQFSIKSLNRYDDQMGWQLDRYSAKSNFARVEDKVEPFLESINIPLTEENITSAKILLHNDIDITEQNLNSALEINSKLDFLKDNLSPTIVAKMLQDGFNPVEENVDDIVSYIDTFKEVFGESNNEKLIKELAKMNKDKNIADKTKDAIKSVYRALNQVSKNGVASVGSLLNEDKNLTLHKLIDSSKTFDKHFNDKTVLDVTLSDNEEYKKLSVTENTNIAKLVSKGVTYNSTAMQLQNLIDNSNFEGLKKYFEENQNNLDELLPIVNTKLKQINSDIDLETVKEITQNISNINQDTLSYLLKNNIKLSRKNLNTFKTLQDDVNLSTKNLNDLVDTDTLDFESKLDENLSLDQCSGKLLDVAIGETQKVNSDIDKIDLHTKTLNLMEMQSYLSEQSDNYYSFPIKLDVTKEVTNLNMFVPDKNALNKNDLNIHLSLHTQKLKDLSVNVDINRDTQKIDFEISTNKDSISLLKNEENSLRETLQDLGYNNVNISYKETDLTMGVTNLF